MDRAVWMLLLPWLLAAAPPPELILPGSQPPEVVAEYATGQEALVGLLHSSDGPNNCAFCHVDFESDAVSIYPTWAGGMMSHASRDPLMWAALAVAEQDFAGIGDTCIRCHVTKGWIEGRSVPSDGSALQPLDGDGVTCHLCHRLADPDDSESTAIGVQAAPFVAAGPVCATGDANAGVACSSVTGMPCSGGPASCVREGFYGNAMIALFQDALTPVEVTRLGPYADAQASSFHAWRQSAFQRDSALCGTCHDVSNPVTGDLAPAHGRMTGPLPAGAFDGTLGGAVASKAAVRNPPYAYGVEQRTYSEWVASDFRGALVSAFDALPAELRRDGGAPELVRDAAAPHGGDYADGTPRGFTCQSCHLRPASGLGCQFASSRSDLPVHDLTGGNTWAPLAVLYLDDASLHGASRLRLGGGLTAQQRAATTAAAVRARATLESAASLALLAPASVLANTVRVVNLTGHKLFTGYPEGRRMWLRVRWYGEGDALVREDGAYGPIAVADDVDGNPATADTVHTLLDPANTHRWEVESGISRAWAQRLVSELGASPSTPLAYDRATGAVAATLADAAAAPEGSAGTPSFHLAWNDVVLHDERIPPWGLDWSEASRRNALPVPATAYLPPGVSPGPGATYLHYDDVLLDPPAGARRATIELLYQTTSWEYVQFLWKTNQKSNAFLASVGDDLLEAWRATGQAEPVVMASVTVPEPGAGAAAAGAIAALAGVARRARRVRPRREHEQRVRSLCSPPTGATRKRMRIHAEDAGDRPPAGRGDRCVDACARPGPAAADRDRERRVADGGDDALAARRPPGRRRQDVLAERRARDAQPERRERRAR